jgi:stage II sporulation SpoE-like protein
MIDRVRRQFAARRRFWASVPARSLAVFLAGVFCTFACLGFLVDVGAAGQTPARLLVLRVVAYGVAALLYAWGGMRDWRFLFLGLAVQLSTQLWGPSHAIARQALPFDALRTRLSVDAMAAMGLLLLGYILMVRFILTDGRRHLRVQAEMALAQRIHETLVPVVSTRGAGYEAYGRSFPTSEVGGDLLDVVERDGAVTCYVADVAGHGVPAGTFMSMVKTACRMRLQRPGPSADGLPCLLADLNAVLAPLKQPSMYATSAWLRLFPGRAEFALAGHPPILHYRHRTACVTPLAARNFPLALLEEATFDADALEPETGDVFALLTDGLTEVADDKSEELGVEGLAAVLAANGTQPLPELFDTLLAAARTHGPQQDDQTLLLVRVNTTV